VASAEDAGRADDDHIEIIKGGKVRRAKLYYLRKLVSKKKSKIEEKIY